MDWWADQSSDLSHMHQFAPKCCSLCHSNTGSKGYNVKNYPVNLQTTKLTPTNVPKITLGTCTWTNEEHFSLKMYSHSLRGTKVATTEGWWLLGKWLECTAAKNPDNSLELMCTSLYILPTLYISITAVTSLNDVMIICFPLAVGKNLAHAQ